MQPFGSIVTGLGIRTSDVDCYVHLPNFIYRQNPVILARNTLKKLPWIFGELFAIPQAKVPILKFRHKPTNCQCDVNFKSPSGVRNSKLIAHLLSRDSRALSLAILVKYWSKVYKFTGTNLMPNYALIMMVIFYLQVRNILPSVYELQRDISPNMVEGWNTAFNKQYKSFNNNDNLYSILGEFFKFYATFDYHSQIISPFTGHPIKKLLFTNVKTVPDEYKLYENNVTNKNCRAMRVDSNICIQDPFDHSRNCTVAVFPKLAQKIIDHFKFAGRMYEERRKEDFLRAVFTEDSQVNVKTATPAASRRNPPNKVTKAKHNNIKHKLKLDFHRWFMENKKIARGKR